MGIPIEINNKMWILYDIAIKCFKSEKLELDPRVTCIYYQNDNRYIVSCAYQTDMCDMEDVVREFSHYISNVNPNVSPWNLSIEMVAAGHRLTGDKPYQNTLFITHDGCTIGPPAWGNYPDGDRVFRVSLSPRFFPGQVVCQVYADDQLGLENPLQIQSVSAKIVIDSSGVSTETFIYTFKHQSFTIRENELIGFQEALNESASKFVNRFRKRIIDK